MRALIVDDEPLARLRLRSMLAEHSDIEVVGECEDAGQAVKAIDRKRPELVFLDIQMPQVDGFGLLQSLGSRSAPQVVFVTAHAQHAARAFEVNAADYLLKPYDEERLARSVQRARGLLASTRKATENPIGPASDYELLEKLGAGAMGVVYKARDRRLQRTVALKFLPPGLHRGPALEPRLLQEAKASAALDHPNVVAIHGIERAADGRPFLVMPFYKGQTLEAMLASGPLAVDRAVDYALQIAAGLAHAHGAGVVHRDVKPANLLVTERNVVKILDFGIAKLAAANLTGTGAILGTLAYMSPEQATGEPVDHRTDLWALGAVLYEMLTGKPPFGDGSESSIYHLFYSIQLKQAVPLQTVRPVVPLELSAIVDRLLKKVPEHRFVDAASLIKELTACLCCLTS